jgi:DNA-directed RNA polymerase subunit L
MSTVEKTRTWKDNWNNVIRDVLFQDKKLRELMLIPEDCTILQFIDKYFVEDENPDEIMTNEQVRIVYYDSRGRDTGNANVRFRYKEFDIYVHKDVLHNATHDRLQNRYD